MTANPASNAEPRAADPRAAEPRAPDPGVEIPPPPWQRLPDRQARRRKEPISRDAIVAAAVQLLDREGLAALSMRRLAEELGTGAASLYRYVDTREDLIDLMIDSTGAVIATERREGPRARRSA